MRVIQSSDYVSEQLERASYSAPRRVLPLAALALSLFATLAIVDAVLQRLRHVTVPAILWWAVALLAASAVLAGAAVALYERAYRGNSARREQLRAGLAGQQIVPRYLAGLDDRYYLVNNLKLPGRSDDIDHVVVGPTGVFALEIKHRRGRIYWRDGQWYQEKRSRGGRLQPEAPMRDPIQQLKRNVDYLRSCINSTDATLSRQSRLWIEGAVVFTHSEVRLDLPQSMLASQPFPVLRARDLPAYITNHIPRQRHNRVQVRRIVSLLAHLKAPDRPYWPQP